MSRPAHRPRTVVDEDAILAAYQTGTSMSAIAIDHEISRDIVRRVIREAENTNVLVFPSSYAPIAPDGFVTSIELLERAGITYRQLDYWCRTGYLHVNKAEPDSGNARFFPTSEIAVARLVAKFIGAGLSPEPAFRLTRQLTETGSALFAGIRVDLPEDLS